jgi:hypothetical protein
MAAVHLMHHVIMHSAKSRCSVAVGHALPAAPWIEMWLWHRESTTCEIAADHNRPWPDRLITTVDGRKCAINHRTAMELLRVAGKRTAVGR